MSRIKYKDKNGNWQYADNTTASILATDVTGMNGLQIKTAYNEGELLKYNNSLIISLIDYALSPSVTGILFETINYNTTYNYTQIHQYHVRYNDTQILDQDNINGYAVTLIEKSKLSGGEIAANNKKFVTGGQVYDAIGDVESVLAELIGGTQQNNLLGMSNGESNEETDGESNSETDGGEE